MHIYSFETCIYLLCILTFRRKSSNPAHPFTVRYITEYILYTYLIRHILNVLYGRTEQYSFYWTSIYLGIYKYTSISTGGIQWILTCNRNARTAAAAGLRNSGYTRRIFSMLRVLEPVGRLGGKKKWKKDCKRVMVRVSVWINTGTDTARVERISSGWITSGSETGVGIYGRKDNKNILDQPRRSRCTGRHNNYPCKHVME